MDNSVPHQPRNFSLPQAVSSLVRIIDLSQQHFSIILLHCNYQFLQQEIIKQFQQSSPFQVLPIAIDPEAITLHAEIQQQMGNHPPDAIVVSGLEQVNDLDQLLSSSNYIREEFRNSFAFPILLWVTDISLNKLIQLAPDLESWTTTLRFAASSEQLIQVLEGHTDRIHEKVLDAGAHGFIPPSLILDSHLHLEVESAFRELQEQQIMLPSALEARVKFVLGLDAYVNLQMALARQYFEQSVSFWQAHHRLKHQGCVFYYLGLWWRRHAALRNSEQGRYDSRDDDDGCYDNGYYDGACGTAEAYFRHCIEVLEQSQRPDLVAKFINALGEVLHRRQRWTELEAMAQRAVQLHETYPEPVRLAFAYGLLAEAKTENQHPDWLEIQQLVERALNILTEFETALPPEIFNRSDGFLHERQNHRGWYALMLATALEQQGAIKEAVVHLERTQRNSKQLSYHLQIKIFRTLRELYLREKHYQKAFQIKRKQYSLQQQYGRRAFVGASYLESSKSFDTQSNFTVTPSQKAGLASEIEASGRDRDVEHLMQKIQSPRYKLLTIYGPSGVGKSSLIHAGLIPKLEQKQSIAGKRILTPIPVLRKYNNGRWLNDLSIALKKAIEQHLDTALLQQFTFPENIASTEAILSTLEVLRDLKFIPVLIFDQLEEFFFTAETSDERKILYQFLDKLLDNSGVKVVLSIRADCLHYLLDCSRIVSLKAIGGDILSRDFLYYLGNLSIESAKSLVRTLTARTRTLDLDLTETLVDDLASKSQEVSPIELQLVGAQLEEEKITTLSRYRKLGIDAEGRIRTLIQAWLGRVVKDCGVEHQSTAWEVLHQLTHHEKIRTIKTQNELMKVSIEPNNRRRKQQIRCILEVLEGSGVISKLREDSKDYYQLAHDYFLPYIRDEYTTRLLNRHDQ